MAAATILHVGDDICHRIPVMERAGLSVVRSMCSVDAVQRELADGRLFSVITFHNDFDPPPDLVICATRTLSTAPLVLFENPTVSCGEGVFDFVIGGPTPPAVWLKSLRKAIDEARNLQQISQQLREECLDLRSTSERLRATAARNRENPIDTLWRDKAVNE